MGREPGPLAPLAALIPLLTEPSELLNFAQVFHSKHLSSTNPLPKPLLSLISLTSPVLTSIDHCHLTVYLPDSWIKKAESKLSIPTSPSLCLRINGFPSHSSPWALFKYRDYAHNHGRILLLHRSVTVVISEAHKYEKYVNFLAIRQ